MSKAADVKVRKRKSASEPELAVKKTKVVPQDAAAPKLKSALKKTASRSIVKEMPAEATSETSKPSRKTRPRAEDLLEEPAETAPSVSAHTRKGNANAKKAESGKNEPTVKAAPTAIVADDASNDEEDGIDDQTAALLAGFESSEDEDEDDEDAADDEAEGLALTKIPEIPNQKQVQKQIQDAQDEDDKSPGVLYVGRIPHGFYEHQMRAYFTQFGEINRLRLSRNKKTGHSKHFAFVEMASASVADIVAKTMDKYLMFGHILQVRRIPADQVHPELFKGAGRRFKPMPRNKIEGGMLRRGATREGWAKRVQNEEKSRNKKAAKLKEMGYEFDMPSVRKVNDVPVKEDQPAAAVTSSSGAVEEITIGEAPVEQKAVEGTEEVAEADKDTSSPSTKRKSASKAKKPSKKVKTAAA